MKKNILLVYAMLLVGSIVNAQSFKLVGERGINTAAEWDKSIPDFAYFDQDGQLYVFFTTDDNVNKKSVNLIKHNFENAQWESVLSEDIVFEEDIEQTVGFGFNDGSNIVVTQQFNDDIDKFFNSMYKISIDGSHEFLQPNPITPDLYNFYKGYPSMAVAPDGTVYLFEYASAAALDSDHLFMKWDGTEWTKLPGIMLSENPRNMSLAINSEGRVYASYYIKNENIAKVVRLSEDQTSWEELFATEQTERFEHDPKIFITHDDEVYLASTTLGGDPSTGIFGLCHIFKQTENGWDEIGTEIRVGLRPSFLKSKSGDLYLTGGDVHDIFKYNTATDAWVPLNNDIQDGKQVSGLFTLLIEGAEDKIYSVFSTSFYEGLTVVEYNPAPLSVDDFAKSEVTIYPNPFEDSFNIKFPKNFSGNYSFELFDIMGRIISKDKIEDGKTNFSVENLAKGMYMLTVKNNNGEKIISKKIIKK